jgi:hypothetical protein
MNQPDIILLAHMNNRDVLAVNFWGEGQVSAPEPGTTDDLPTVIRHFTSHGYTYHRNYETTMLSTLLVKVGCDVAASRQTVNKFLLEQVRAMSV